jgi:hypothetical protein
MTLPVMSNAKHAERGTHVTDAILSKFRFNGRLQDLPLKVTTWLCPPAATHNDRVEQESEPNPPYPP